MDRALAVVSLAEEERLIRLLILEELPVALRLLLVQDFRLQQQQQQQGLSTS